MTHAGQSMGSLSTNTYQQMPKRRRLCKGPGADRHSQASQGSLQSELAQASEVSSQHPDLSQADTGPVIPTDEASLAVSVRSSLPSANERDRAETPQASDEDAEANTDDIIKDNELLCAVCDDGGSMFQCDGGCARSFHFGGDVIEDEHGKEHAEYDPDICNPLYMPTELAEAVRADNVTWSCPNCVAHQHQCFICKLNGRSDNTHGLQEVFRCHIPGCGHYYHPQCINKTAADCAATSLFRCPIHKCVTCGKGPKYEQEREGNLIACRRCPAAYHRTCIPAGMTDASPQRVWIADGVGDAREDADKGDAVAEEGKVQDGKGFEKDLAEDICYCLKHDIPAGESAPKHTKLVISSSLLHQWHLHMARSYKSLPWSNQLLAKRERQLEADLDVPLAKRQLVKNAAVSHALHKPSQKTKAAQRPVPANSNSLVRKDGSLPTASKLAVEAKPILPKPKVKVDLLKAKHPHPVQPSLKSTVLKGSEISAASGPVRFPAQPTKPSKVPVAKATPPATTIPTSAELHGPGRPAAITEASLSAASLEAATSVSAAIAAPHAELKASTSAVVPVPAAIYSAETDAATPAGDLPLSADILSQPVQPKSPARIAVAEARQPKIVSQAVRVPPVRSGDASSVPSSSMTPELSMSPADSPPLPAAVEVPQSESPRLLKLATMQAALAMPPPAPRPALELNTLSHEQVQASTSDYANVLVIYSKKVSAFDVAAVDKSVRKPEPYAMSQVNTVEQAQLDVWTGAMRLTKHRLSKADSPEKQKAACAEVKAELFGRKLVNAAIQREDILRIKFQPFLQRDRYTSYGRHFTLDVKLQALSERLVTYINDGDLVVDFSCGANDWVHRMQAESSKRGLRCYGKAYDIITPINVQNFEQRSWFAVEPGALGRDNDRLVIGLNPPFGANGTLAEKFTRHAAKFQPRLIALIVPPSVSTPKDYEILYEDRDQMEGKAFEIPGGVGPSWNNTTPPVRVLVRKDKFEETRRRIHDRLHLARCFPPPFVPAPMHPGPHAIHQGAMHAQQAEYHGHFHPHHHQHAMPY